MLVHAPRALCACARAVVYGCALSHVLSLLSSLFALRSEDCDEDAGGRDGDGEARAAARSEGIGSGKSASGGCGRGGGVVVEVDPVVDISRPHNEAALAVDNSVGHLLLALDEF